MDRSFGLSPTLAIDTMTATDTPRVRSAGGAPVDGEQLSGSARTSPPTASPSPRDHHDRMVQRMNDVVVRRIFAAGLDLQAALGLIGEHPTASERRAAGKICHASDELDRAIRDLRDILFEGGPELSPGYSAPR